ncbi:LD-carboxypeptidase [Haloferax sp. Atlit-10N]|uniref:S66 family peptidase n=1 Tax=Haloferax TaxID=2251 RepID=UPI000679D766|nr:MULTISPECIES: S66 peptidase family protein [Haloferax]RDZ44655.1 LD-carboxypeptidase [Haloferax sp. Atlit-16N]RDZ48009.1 LD-carboxypeptidase [Haloferax sp. Atlit-19N]RDZ59565.1 LD-carboxypeptidase [Haloferax sp. Atlit-10N]
MPAVFTTPPPLDSGSRVAVVAPSRPIDESHLDRACARLRDVFSLDPVVFESARRDWEWLRDNPAARAEDVMEAFEDPSIRGVIAVTGGDDQLRILPHLDPARLTASPTRFFGFSDNDNLRLFLWTHGVVSYGATLHPTLTVDPELHPYVERYLRRAFFERSIGVVEPAPEWTDDWFDFDTEDPREWHDNPGRTWRGDERVTGRLWGGNFSVLKWHLQTDRYLPDPEELDGAVLALETSEDVPLPREVRYTLRSMGERGLLARFDGLVMGRPRTYSPGLEWEPPADYGAQLRAEVLSVLDAYNPDATAVFDVEFGHADPTVPLPLGAKATLDPTVERLRVD